MTELLLQVKNLKVCFGAHWILQDIDLDIHSGEAVALSGPSGCGKSLAARALCGLLPASAQWEGSICWKGQELAGDAGAGWNQVRGGGVSLILQEPATGLNPVLTVGKQIAETWVLHHPAKKANWHAETIRLLNEVHIPDPEKVFGMHPHELSGGMRQRILLAAALACEPDLLIADEPTTALDPTVQREILSLLTEVRRRRQMAMLFITHDPDLAALLSDRACVMEQGRLFPCPLSVIDTQHNAIAAMTTQEVKALAPVLTARNLVVEYSSRGWKHFSQGSGQPVRAVDGVDLELRPGVSVGLAGESGCGKTTLARALVRQIPVQSGELLLDGMDFLATKGEALRKGRRMGQLVFQDPAASLNPRQKVGVMLREAAGEHFTTAEDLLAEVGLNKELINRYGHQLSGGQRQRVALARALAAQPVFLVADEVTSALDPEASNTILLLLSSIMKKRNLAVLQISHDLNLLQRWCHQVQVMLDGIILEVYPGGKGGAARHPYTRNLIASMPIALRAQEPSLHEEEKPARGAAEHTGEGCPWSSTCKDAISTCYKVLPPLALVADGHLSRCPVVEGEGSSTFIDT